MALSVILSLGAASIPRPELISTGALRTLSPGANKEGRPDLGTSWETPWTMSNNSNLRGKSANHRGRPIPQLPEAAVLVGTSNRPARIFTGILRSGRLHAHSRETSKDTCYRLILGWL